MADTMDRETINKTYRRAFVTGAADVAATLAPGAAFELREIRVHLSAAGGANNLTVTADSGLGAAYDVVHLTQDMTSVVNLCIIFQPEEKMFGATDELDFAWTNGSTRTYGLEVVYKVF